MHLQYVPLLQVQRDLYRLPRGMDRFRAYLRTMLNDAGDELALPLTGMNPMAKEHVPDLLDRYIGLEADTAASNALANVPASLTAADYRVTLVITDDLKGGWTNRYAVEFTSRFQLRSMLRRGWIAGVLWTSEEPSARTACIEVLTAVFRAAWVEQHGEAVTLGERMAQEGYALRQAGVTVTLDGEELAYTREIIEPLRGATDMPTTVAVLFGDDAAKSLGLRPHGLSFQAGLQLALSEVTTPQIACC